MRKPYENVCCICGRCGALTDGSALLTGNRQRLSRTDGAAAKISGGAARKTGRGCTESPACAPISVRKNTICTMNGVETQSAAPQFAPDGKAARAA